MFAPNSNKCFWWKCKFGHSCLVRIADKTKGHGCNECRLVNPPKAVKKLNTIDREASKEHYREQKKIRKSEASKTNAVKINKTPATALTLTKIQQLEAEVMTLRKEVAQFKELNDFLGGTANLFAASSRKSQKKNATNSSH